MNFDHMRLCIKLGIHTIKKQKGKTQQGHKKVHAIGKILINHENQELFVVALKQHFQWEKSKTENKEDNAKTKYISNKMLIPLIHKALKLCKRSWPKKRISKNFPTNPWYDEECKATKRSLKEKERNRENRKRYKNIIKKKLM